MIDFKKELDKFRPMNEIDDIEEAIANDELEDILDLLKAVGKNNKSGEE